MKRLMRFATITALVAIPLACGGAHAAPPRTPHARSAPRPAPVAKDDACRALPDPLDPALVAWDADDRALVRALGRHGVVAVRYYVNGCGAALEVLPGCTADARYAFTSAPAVRHDFVWKVRDLQSGFPLGAPALVGAVANHEALRLDESKAGVLSLSGVRRSYPAGALHGPDCMQATHVVASIVVGSFTLAVGGGDAVRGLAAGSGADADDQVLAEEGDAAECGGKRVGADGAPLCATALRVGLVPIAGVPRAAPACPPGREWLGAGCVPRLGTSCGNGLHYDTTRGCVPDDATQQPAADLEAWYAAHENEAADARRLVGVAYQIAEMRFVGGSGDPGPWWDRTVAAFKRWSKTDASADTPEAAMAAEAAYRRLDAWIARDFDYSTGHHHYTGTAVAVIKQLHADARRARPRGQALVEVAEDYRQPVWTIAELARRGSLWDSLRKGMVHAREPEVVMFDEHTRGLLAEADASNSPLLVRKAETIRIKVRRQWRRTAAREIDGVSAAAIVRYAMALALARHYHVDNAVVRRTLRRLEVLEIAVGPAKMRKAMRAVPGLEYRPGMFSAL